MESKKGITVRAALRSFKSFLKNNLGILTPISAQWEITYRCNMRCKFCNIWKYGKKYYKTEVALSEAKRIIQEMADLGVFYINFTGGEPLLRHDFHKILKACKKNDMIISMNDNGFFLKEKYDKIKEYIDIICISLDSPYEKEHNRIRGTAKAYSKTLDAARYIRNNGGRVRINMTVTKENIKDMERMVELCKEYDLPVHFIPVNLIPVEWNKNKEAKNLLVDSAEYMERVKTLHKKYSKVWYYEPYFMLLRRGGIHKDNFVCYSSSTMLNLKPDGSIVFPCGYYPKVRYNTMGKNLGEIWNLYQRKFKRQYYNFCKGCTSACFLVPSLAGRIKNLLYFYQFLCSFIRYNWR
jgi:MoaA/NifB/PqqE/SkfB family radical SAM enzyme